jgi:hypothetical protein
LNFYFRVEKNKMVFCGQCGTEVNGKFCGKCGAKAPEAAGGGNASDGTLSVFDQNALKQKNQHVQRDTKFSGTRSNYVGMGFGYDQMKKAQAQASSASRPGWTGTGTTTEKKWPNAYHGTFGDEQRKKAQAAASNLGRDKFAGARPTGAYVGTFGDEQRKKAQAAASNLGRDKFAGAAPTATGGGLTIVEADQLEKQKMVSEARRGHQDNLRAAGVDKNQCAQAGLGLVDAAAVEHQKLNSDSLRSKTDAIIMSEDGAAGSVAHAANANNAAPTVADAGFGFCDSCGTPRADAETLFCGECGTKFE